MQFLRKRIGARVKRSFTERVGAINEFVTVAAHATPARHDLSNACVGAKK
jgi:hypothetical protein